MIRIFRHDRSEIVCSENTAQLVHYDVIAHADSVWFQQAGNPGFCLRLYENKNVSPPAHICMKHFCFFFNNHGSWAGNYDDRRIHGNFRAPHEKKILCAIVLSLYCVPRSTVSCF